MTQEKSRRIDPVLKLIIVELVDEFGATKLVQQPMSFTSEEIAAANYADPDTGKPRNTILDWTEAVIEDAKRAMDDKNAGFAELVDQLGLTDQLKGAAQ